MLAKPVGGGTIRIAHGPGVRVSPLYDRTGDEITLDAVEKFLLRSAKVWQIIREISFYGKNLHASAMPCRRALPHM
jgi:hypothetical protein